MVNYSTPDLFSNDSWSRFQNPGTPENSSNYSMESSKNVGFVQIERKQCSLSNGSIPMQNQIGEVSGKPSSKALLKVLLLSRLVFN